MITWASVTDWLFEHGIPILIMIAAGVILWFVLQKLLPPLVGRFMARPARGESERGTEKRRDTLIGVFRWIGRILIILIVLLMILAELDINIGPVLAGFGIAGIAVGFGAQYLVRDLIAGIFILGENQYRVGDVARIADVSGLVEQITLRKTVLRDMDGVVHHVPNGEIRVASNHSRHFSRVNLDVPVDYGTDLDHAISVINRVGQDMAADENWRDRFVTSPQVLGIEKFGDSGIELKIVGDVKPSEQWAIMRELRLRLKKAFDAEGIEIPWPHTKVYFGNSKPKSQPEN